MDLCSCALSLCIQSTCSCTIQNLSMAWFGDILKCYVYSVIIAMILLYSIIMLHVFAEADEIARDLKIIYLYIYIHLMHRSLSQSCDLTVGCLWQEIVAVRKCRHDVVVAVKVLCSREMAVTAVVLLLISLFFCCGKFSGKVCAIINPKLNLARDQWLFVT